MFILLRLFSKLETNKLFNKARRSRKWTRIYLVRKHLLRSRKKFWWPTKLKRSNE